MRPALHRGWQAEQQTWSILNANLQRQLPAETRKSVDGWQNPGVRSQGKQGPLAQDMSCVDQTSILAGMWLTALSNLQSELDLGGKASLRPAGVTSSGPREGWEGSMTEWPRCLSENACLQGRASGG